MKIKNENMSRKILTLIIWTFLEILKRDLYEQHVQNINVPLK